MKAASRDGGPDGRVSPAGPRDSSGSASDASQSGVSSGRCGGCSGSGSAAARCGVAGVGLVGAPGGSALRVRRSSASRRRRSTRSRTPVVWSGEEGVSAPSSFSSASVSPASGAAPPSATRLRTVRLQCSPAVASGGGCRAAVRSPSPGASDSSAARAARRRSVSSTRSRVPGSRSRSGLSAGPASGVSPDSGSGFATVAFPSGPDPVAPAPRWSGLTERDRGRRASWVSPAPGMVRSSETILPPWRGGPGIARHSNGDG